MAYEENPWIFVYVLIHWLLVVDVHITPEPKKSGESPAMLPHNTMLQRGQSRLILSFGHCGEWTRELLKALHRLGSVGTLFGSFSNTECL